MNKLVIIRMNELVKDLDWFGYNYSSIVSLIVDKLLFLTIFLCTC